MWSTKRTSSSEGIVPNCDFYALAPDLIDVLDFVFAQPGWLLVELASRNDQPLRSFHATREVLDGFPAFSSLRRSMHFNLYSEAMGGKVTSRRIDFTPGAVPGATFRYDSGGWGLIQLYFGALRDGRLSNCHTNHNSERRASNWEPTYADRLDPANTWNWAEVTRTSGRLNRFLRRMAPGKLRSRPVLQAAWEAQSTGEVKLA
jgi:hypothetical protein